MEAPLAIATRVHFVLHTREARRHATTSAALHPLLADSAIELYGARDQPLDLSHLAREGRRVLVLFPWEGATALDSNLLARDRRPVTLVVPDGTWRQARRATLRVPGLNEAEVVRFAEDDLSTCEALVRALAVLEGPSTAEAFRERVKRLAPQAIASPAPGLQVEISGVISHEEPLEILYRDEFLVAINKPSGMLVHKGWGTDRRPALQRLRDQLGKRVHAIHRLDRATSGVLLFALSSEVARDMQRLFESGQVRKRYLAVCRGVRLESDRIDHPLRAEKGGALLPAVTRVRVLGTFERYALIEAYPETGRTHQIRRHLKHVSLPIIGDVRYGKGEHNRLFRERFGFHRLALHCASSSFPHPRSREDVEISAPLPQDLGALVASFG